MGILIELKNSIEKKPVSCSFVLVCLLFLNNKGKKRWEGFNFRESVVLLSR